jgi:hypothetical protein
VLPDWKETLVLLLVEPVQLVRRWPALAYNDGNHLWVLRDGGVGGGGAWL